MTVNGRVAALRREIDGADDNLKRWGRMVEDGMTDLDDILEERLAGLKQERDGAKAALAGSRSRNVSWRGSPRG